MTELGRITAMSAWDLSVEQVLEKIAFQTNTASEATCRLLLCDDSDGRVGKMEWRRVGGVLPRCKHVDLHQSSVT